MTDQVDTNSLVRAAMLDDLVGVFKREGYIVKGVKDLEQYADPPLVKNSGFGSGRPRMPDVAGLDKARRRIVFGLVRTNRKSLDTEEALEEYNVFLDHNESLGPRASLLLIEMPAHLLPEFTSMITHYIHREYWHRIIPVAYSPGGNGHPTPPISSRE